MKYYLVSHPYRIHLELLVFSITYGLNLTPPISLSLGPLHVSISASLKFIMRANLFIPFTQNFMSHMMLSFLKIFSPFKPYFHILKIGLLHLHGKLLTLQPRQFNLFQLISPLPFPLPVRESFHQW